MGYAEKIINFYMDLKEEYKVAGLLLYLFELFLNLLSIYPVKGLLNLIRSFLQDNKVLWQ